MLPTPWVNKLRRLRPSNRWLGFLLWFVFVLKTTAMVSNVKGEAAPAPLSANVKSKIQQAMEFTTASTKNITAAEEACKFWGDILDADHGIQRKVETTSDTVVGLSYALYASCLVRTGQDKKAVEIFEEALRWNPDNTKNQRDMRMGKAQALQRLLRYSEALHEYQLLGKTEEGMIGAATCALRSGDISLARKTLGAYLTSKGPDTTTTNPEAEGMYGVLQYLESGNSTDPAIEESLRNAAKISPLYYWIFGALFLDLSLPLGMDQSKWAKEGENPLLPMIRINLCAFDDPNLILLDDKVLLQNLLNKYRSRTSGFWPQGVVLLGEGNDDGARLDELILGSGKKDSLWILKQRSGYGSHGNRILSTSEAHDVATLQRRRRTVEEGSLLQRMVDPLLLINGRKFSLRIYVVYFSPSEVYLSSVGLVKLASTAVRLNKDDSQSLDPSIHMTNSGREESMEQFSLDYFRDYLEKSNHSYAEFWNAVQSAVRAVFYCYKKEALPMGWGDRRQKLGVPKIMGFDFVVDDHIQPWLVEVNRFPGLEPRDQQDRQVKQQVLQQTWNLATERLLKESCPTGDGSSLFELI